MTVRRLAPFVLVACVAAGCAAEPELHAEMGPVFAIDRDVTSEISEVDPARVDVMAAADLRILLNQLMSEHSGLAVQVMRAAVVGGQDLEPAIAALQANTDEFTLAIGLVYGPTGARAFDQLWTQHIEFFVDYAEARGNGDDQAAQEAHDQLGDYALDFSSFATTATGGVAGLDVVLGLLHDHVHQLITQTDAWAAGDHQLAHELAAEAQRHADVIAAALAGAIAGQQPAVFTGSVDDPDTTERARLHTAASALPRALATFLTSSSTEGSDTTAAEASLDAAVAELATITGTDVWVDLSVAWIAGDSTAADTAVASLDDELGGAADDDLTDLLQSIGDGGLWLTAAIPADAATAQQTLADMDDDMHELAELLHQRG